jgi:hypothetical protein
MSLPPVTAIDRALAAVRDPRIVLPHEPPSNQFLTWEQWCRLDDQVDAVWKRAGRRRP